AAIRIPVIALRRRSNQRHTLFALKASWRKMFVDSPQTSKIGLLPFMNPKSRFRSLGVFLICLLASCSIAATFRVATYNVEIYLDEPTQTRVAKSAEAKAKVRDSILALKPDVIALQEIGAISALQELRASLKDKELDLPYCEHVAGADT